MSFGARYPIYSGPTEGVSSGKGFERFVSEDLVRLLRDNGIDHHFNTEEIGPFKDGLKYNIYDFVGAGFGIEHEINPNEGTSEIAIVSQTTGYKAMVGLFFNMQKDLERETRRN